MGKGKYKTMGKGKYNNKTKGKYDRTIGKGKYCLRQ